MSKYPTLTHYDSLLKMPAYTKAHVYLRSMRRGVCKKHEVKSSPNKFGIRPTIKTVHSSKSYLHRYLQLLLILSWTPNTSLWRTVFLVPEESSHLFSKFKPLNTDGPSMSTTENFSCLINRFSQKVSLAYVDTSLSTGCRHMLLRVKKPALGACEFSQRYNAPGGYDQFLTSISGYLVPFHVYRKRNLHCSYYSV